MNNRKLFYFIMTMLSVLIATVTSVVTTILVISAK